MPTKLLKYKPPKHYNLHMVCHTHGWKNLAPFNWDESNQSINFAVYKDSIPIDISVFQKNDKIEALIKADEMISSRLEDALRAIINRSLALEIDTSKLLLQAESIGTKYSDLIKQGAGRLLRAPTLWEDAAKTLFTTNCSWALTQKICNTVCSGLFVPQSPSGCYPFPPPERFLIYDEFSLKKAIPIGYRAAYLISLAKKFAQDPNLNGLENGTPDYETAFKIVNQCEGFGRYASNHMMILAGFYNEIPVDSVVVSYLKKTHRVRKPYSFIKRHYRKWGRYQWWGFKLEKMIYGKNWLGN